MTDKLLEMTTDIVSSYVSANEVDAGTLPELIQSVFKSLTTLGQEPLEVKSVSSSKPTAAAIRKSITPEAIISFIDGRPYKMLKRHLTTHGLTFEDYKAKFGLPSDYPATAPAYSERRSDLAKHNGLGRRPADVSPEPVPAKRGRPKKVLSGAFSPCNWSNIDNNKHASYGCADARVLCHPERFTISRGDIELIEVNWR